MATHLHNNRHITKGTLNPLVHIIKAKLHHIIHNNLTLLSHHTGDLRQLQGVARMVLGLGLQPLRLELSEVAVVTSQTYRGLLLLVAEVANLRTIAGEKAPSPSPRIRQLIKGIR